MIEVKAGLDWKMGASMLRHKLKSCDPSIGYISDEEVEALSNFTKATGAYIGAHLKLGEVAAHNMVGITKELGKLGKENR